MLTLCAFINISFAYLHLKLVCYFGQRNEIESEQQLKPSIAGLMVDVCRVIDEDASRYVAVAGRPNVNTVSWSTRSRSPSPPASPANYIFPVSS